MKTEETAMPPLPEPNIEEGLRARIADLENQVAGLENFANAVVQQRNEAQNEAAKYLGQLTAAVRRGG